MNDSTVTATYFATPVQDNTERVLQIARARAEQLGVRSIVVATT